MGCNGIIVLPAPATHSSHESYLASAVVDRLYALHQLESAGKWQLEHRLYRETPWTNGHEGSSSASAEAEVKAGTAQSASRVLQTLTRSVVPHVAHAGITTPSPVGKDVLTNGASGSTGTGTGAGAGAGESTGNNANTTTTASSPDCEVVALSMPQGLDSFVALLRLRLAPLYLLRQVGSVVNSQALRLGDGFVIRVADLRVVQGNLTQIRGTVIEVERLGDGDGDGEARVIATRDMLGQLQQQLAVKDARVYLPVHQEGAAASDPFANVKTWLEALRLRA